MNDLISRQDAIDALAKLPNVGVQWYINFESARFVSMKGEEDERIH